MSLPKRLTLRGDEGGVLRMVFDLMRGRLRFWRSSEYWSRLRLRVTRSRDVHQIATVTCMDRYPEIFASCREFFRDRPNLNILSFGCATGEEVATLRTYFPSAIITGAEINRHALAVCRRQIRDNRTAFVESQDEIVARGPYNGIFCMAVLQRSPQRVNRSGLKNLARVYPFSKFEAQIARFDAWLPDGGLLVLEHTQYRFEDTATAERYRALGPRQTATIRFEPNGNRAGRESLGSIFIKERSLARSHGQGLG